MDMCPWRVPSHSSHDLLYLIMCVMCDKEAYSLSKLLACFTLVRLLECADSSLNDNSDESLSDEDTVTSKPTLIDRARCNKNLSICIVTDARALIRLI